MIEKFLTQTQFADYDDFCKNLHIRVPEHFNFAYDVVDEYARTDPVRGQVVKATIVLAKEYVKNAGDQLVKEIQNHVKRITAPYKYPRIVEFVKEIPKTISWKIRHVAIRQADSKAS